MDPLKFNATKMFDDKEVNFDNLYPALVTCFTIILTGYISGRTNLITQTEVKGIHTLVSYYALPSLIFSSMVKLDMGQVNWMFLLAIFISKVIVFFVVLTIVLLVTTPTNRGKAGLLSIFTTQSNDFAIGYPIVTALYGTSHPEFPNYMYLLAPINLAILNPIAFILIEMDKMRSNMQLAINSSSNSHKITCIFSLKILQNIIKNPIILSTLLGLVGNAIFNHSLPVYFDNVLKICGVTNRCLAICVDRQRRIYYLVLGNAFSACALFTLGMRMVGKVHTLSGIRMMVPALLILAKLLALPVLIREVVNLLSVGKDDKDTLDWSTFGFLYGTLPSAPTVFVFAVHYSIESDLIATSMVACTFVSAPWMFISAKMITLTKTDPSQYMNVLVAYIVDISIVSLVASCWVLIIFMLTKKVWKIPHKFTVCLVISQVFSCIGSILYKFVDHKEDIPSYIQFGFFNTGVYSCRMWTAIIAMTLLFMENRSYCFILFKLQPFFMIFGWGLPILLTFLLLMFDKDKSLPFDQRNPNFIYGDFQAIIAVSLLVLCFIVTAGCLILHEMYRRRYGQPWQNGELTSDLIVNSSDNEEPSNSTTSSPLLDDSPPKQQSCSYGNCSGAGTTCCSLPTINESGENTPNNVVTDIEDLFSEPRQNNTNVNGNATNPEPCPSGLGCRPDHQSYCQGIIQQYQEAIDDDLELFEEERSSHDPQILRHIVLLIFLMCSMFVGLAVSIWTLVMEKMSGIYIELAFLDVTLNFGQSIIVFAVFGTDTKDVLLPLLKRWRKLWFRTNKLILPMLSELNQETNHICEQFKNHHLIKCENDIASTKRFRLKTYEQVFSGKKLVDWLIDVGLARDRIEAVNYARHLLEGRIIRHINEVYHFYDKNLLYTFK